MRDLQRLVATTATVCLLAVGSAHAGPAPEARLISNFDQWDGRTPFRGCDFRQDSLTLYVTDGARLVLRHDLCSSEGKGAARIVTDAGGHLFLLLEYSEGHGTNVWTDHLAVYRVTDRLEERSRIVLSQAAGPTSRWKYAYDVRTPEADGLSIELHRSVEGNGKVEIDLPPQHKSLRVPS